MSEPLPASSVSGDELAAAVRASIIGWLRSFAKVTTWIYVGGLAALIAWLEFAGERFWLTGILLFAPPQVLLLPLVFLTPFCLLVLRWRLLGWHLLAVILVAFVYMTFRWDSPPPPAPGELGVVTHNVGQGSKAQLFRFVDQQQPDLILVQDARGRGPEFARRFPDRHVAVEGEFALVSRWPVRRSGAVALKEWSGRPVAARFEIAREEPMAVYNVHLPTPRSQLNQFLSGRALVKMFADDTSGKSPNYTQWTQTRLGLAARLADVFREEQLPFIVCGDFNTPDHGVIYRTFSSFLKDAHRHAGRGWGLTFPGTSRNPLTRNGPWLRIDYAFGGRGWTPIWSTPESGRISQHCAVAARFVPKSE